MRCLLNEAKICGIKNIDKEVTLSFTNKNLSESAFEESYIKTIYGCNGAGKSGITHAFGIIKEIALSDFPFKDHSFASELSSLINKKTRRFSMGLTFTTSELCKYRYSLAVSLSDANEPFISFESLETLSARGDSKKVIFRTENGVLAELPKQRDAKDEASPVLNKSTSLLTRLCSSTKQQNEKLEKPISDLIVFLISLDATFGSESDVHGSNNLKVYLGSGETKKALVIWKVSQSFKGGKYAWALYPACEKRFVEAVEKLSHFLRLAKPDLVKVEATFDRDREWTYASLRFHYDGFPNPIDYEFESTGIKKLCSLFWSLEAASNGGVVVIDEIDAGVHDLFLINLIEYFALYKPCQIIMTTHNIDLMDSVNGLSKSIDILTDEPSVVPWVKKGTLSAISQYKKGYLGGVPVNLNPIDFAPIFNDEE